VNDWVTAGSNPDTDEALQATIQNIENVQSDLVSIPDFIEQVFVTNTELIPSEHCLNKVDSCFNTILNALGAKEMK
jgi:hypothetical protein